MFAPSVTICEMLSQNIHDLDLDLWNGLRSNVNTQIERRYAYFYLLAIAMFVLSVGVWETITNERSNVLDSNLKPLK